MKCVSYKVDPIALQQGVPVELLEKKNLKLDSGASESMEQMNKFDQNLKRLFLGSKEYHQHPKTRITLQLNSSDYEKAKSGRLIKISEAIARHDGKEIKLMNKQTGSYVLRTLVVFFEGDRGYFQ